MGVGESTVTSRPAQADEVRGVKSLRPIRLRHKPRRAGPLNASSSSRPWQVAICFAIVAFLGAAAVSSFYIDPVIATAYLSADGGLGCATTPNGGVQEITPAPRAGAAIAYGSDSTGPFALMFGGIGANTQSPLGDTWEYRSGCWYQYCTECSPGSGGYANQLFDYTGSLQTWTVPASVSSINVNVQGGEGGNGTTPSGGVQDFSCTGADTTWSVPSGVTSISVTAIGAAGGSGIDTGGNGGEVQATVAVSSGETIYVNVGCQGASNTDNGAGGFNGGGAACRGTCDYPGSHPGPSYYAGAGGGASDIRLSADTWSDVALVAGGGGGGGGGESQPTDGAGGAGGSASASEGAAGSGAAGYDGGAGDGGGAGTGGSNAGGGGGTGYSGSGSGTDDNGAAGACGSGSSDGAGGAGGSNNFGIGGGGGGGGGWCGGGGGGDGYYDEQGGYGGVGGGGAGGSSYCSAACSSVTYTQGAASATGNGAISITYGGSGNTASFTYQPNVQTWTVPAGVTSLTLDLAGAAGQPGTCPTSEEQYCPSGTVGAGGDGGRVQATVSVSAGNTIDLYVAGGTGGYPGGGAAGSGNHYGNPGGDGGGYTEIYDASTSTILAIAAGGGGGGGAYDDYNNAVAGTGGNGGNPGVAGGSATGGSGVYPGSGGSGATSGGGGAGGAGQTCSGTSAGPGSAGSSSAPSGGGASGGAGGYVSGSTSAGAGGGGGGYYGGGGGGEGCYAAGGGGGGYSYVPSGTSISYTTGYETGAGYAKISYGSSAAAGIGGLGDVLTATLAVTPGHVLDLYVGGDPSSASSGYPGGGAGGACGNADGGGGGGYSEIYDATSSTILAISAGGGGGGGAATGGTGGNGGIGGNPGSNGVAGSTAGDYGRGAPSNSAGGAASTGYVNGGGAGGSSPPATGGTGGCSSGNPGGGGGGGGYTAGGGGGDGQTGAGGGGGGFSYVPSGTSIVYTGTSSGNGLIEISYATPNAQVFSYTGASQSWTVPAGITTIGLTVTGGAGEAGTARSGTEYGVGGDAGVVTIPALTVTPGQQLTILVGGDGASQSIGTAPYPGGGPGNSCAADGSGGNGGGYSEVETPTGTVWVVAGGGGGGGGSYETAGVAGAGGAGATATTGYGTTGGTGTGTAPDGTGGAGGTNTGGGTFGTGEASGTAGAAFTGGTGGNACSSTDPGGGGGGGGYYGGGGGGSGYVSGGGGGGGDSDALVGSSITYAATGTGDGYVNITYQALGVSPPARFGESLVFDALLDEFVMFGGCSLDGVTSGSSPELLEDTCTASTTDILGDTWVWSTSGSCTVGAVGSTGGCWSEVCATGSCGITDSNGKTGLYGTSSVYDPNSGQCDGSGNGCVLMWGGADVSSTSLSTHVGPCSAAACNSDAWYFGGTSPGSWNTYAALDPSRGVAWQSVSYVGVQSEVFAYGGDYYSTTSAFNCFSQTCETWSYNEFYGGTGAWSSTFYDNTGTCASNTHAANVEPPSSTCTWMQEQGSGIYDTSTSGILGSGNTGDVVLFGGAYLTNDDNYADQWTGGYWVWVPASDAAGTWTLTSSNYPLPTDAPASFYDSGKGFIIALGGWDTTIGGNLGVIAFD